MKPQSIQSASQLFHVLSDETRLRLISALQDGEKHVTSLCKKLRVPQPTVSHHLALLRIHGLLINRRRGKSVFYSINEEAFKRGAVLAAELFNHQR